jgi:DNA-binding transcriptional LysR family regulator
MAAPNLPHLLTFLAVAKQLNFQKASNELNLSTSAVSHAIRTLEDRLGVSLFNRTTRSVALTAAGEHFLNRLEPLLSGVGDVIDEMNLFRDRPSGHLRINTSRYAAHLVVVPLMARFLAAFPDISLDIVDDNGIVDIVGSGFDAGIRFMERVPEDMVVVPLGGECRFATVVTPSWFASHEPVLHPNDLLSHECVRYRFPSGRTFHWEFEKEGQRIDLDVRGRISVGDQDLALAAATDGIGPAFIFEDVARDAIASGQLVRVLEDWCPPFPGPMLYYPQQRRVCSALRTFIDMARAKA